MTDFPPMFRSVIFRVVYREKAPIGYITFGALTFDNAVLRITGKQFLLDQSVSVTLFFRLTFLTGMMFSVLARSVITKLTQRFSPFAMTALFHRTLSTKNF